MRMFSAPGADETDRLDEDAATTPTSRLACQIRVDESIAGLRVRLLDPWR